MNWATADTALLAHARRLGQIRRDNPVIARGRQRTLLPHLVLRYAATDTILICLNPSVPIPVASLFPSSNPPADGTLLRELYSGRTLPVINGHITLPSHLPVALLRPDSPQP